MLLLVLVALVELSVMPRRPLVPKSGRCRFLRQTGWCRPGRWRKHRGTPLADEPVEPVSPVSESNCRRWQTGEAFVTEPVVQLPSQPLPPAEIGGVEPIIDRGGGGGGAASGDAHGEAEIAACGRGGEAGTGNHRAARVGVGRLFVVGREDKVAIAGRLADRGDEEGRRLTCREGNSPVREIDPHPVNRAAISFRTGTRQAGGWRDEIRKVDGEDLACRRRVVGDLRAAATGVGGIDIYLEGP